MNTPSTKNLSALPDIDTLKKLSKSLAVLDAIISPDWEYRYYSYNSDWDEGEEFASMRDGQGDEYQILFNKYGAIINGFAHESEMNGWSEPENGKGVLNGISKSINGNNKSIKQSIWPGVIDNIPLEFKEFISTEPVPSLGTTFCIWRKNEDSKWNIGSIEFPEDDYGDGSEDLLFILDTNPETYKEWAEEYYDENFSDSELPLSAVKKIYNGEPVTKNLVLEINSDFEDFEQLAEDLQQINYPYSF